MNVELGLDKVKVVFLGSRPLGHLTLTLLESMEDVDVVATVVKEPPLNAWWATDPYEIARNNISDHRELMDIDFDLGISINYWKIIDSDLIKKPKLGFINLHHSYNLCLRGRDMTSRAIINARNSNVWYHGTALHYTDDGLDTGPIIASKACEITEMDTAWTLFQRGEALGCGLIQEWLPRLIKARAPVAYPEPNHPLSMRTVDDKKFIGDINANPILTYDTVRAYDFKLHYPPAFTIIEGNKVFLTTDKDLAGDSVLRIDDDRVVYKVKINNGW